MKLLKYEGYNLTFEPEILTLKVFKRLFMRDKTKDKSRFLQELGYIYFIAQLIFNLLWTPSFFYLKNIVLALIVVIFLDIFVVLAVKSFYKVSKISGLILIPYLIWILFATYLNIGYFVLNA